MAKTRSIINSFLSGELSPLLKGNTGLAQYYQGLEQAKNVVIVPQGGVKRRAGTEFVDINAPEISRLSPSSPTMPNGGTPANINDNDDSTDTATTTGIGAFPYVVASFDLGSAQDVYFADVRELSISASGFSGNDYVIQYSDNNADWFNAAALAPDVSTSPRNYRVRSTQGAHRYWRLALTGGSGTLGYTLSLSGIDFYISAGSLSGSKLIDFNTSSSFRYVISITDGNGAAVYSPNPTITSVVGHFKLPYASGEVRDVRSATVENVCLLFHENHPTQRIILTEPFYFNVDLAPYTNVPTFDFNDDLSPTPISEQQDITFSSFSRGMNYKVDVDGILSKDITFAGDSTPDEQATTEFNLRKNLQDMPNFGETGISVNRQGANQYRITIGGESADSFRLFSGFNTTGSSSAGITFTKITDGSPRKEALWSSSRGYPRMGAFFEGRLWIGGTRDKKQTLLASKSGDLLNFEVGEGDDDEAIFQTITSRTLTEITDIYPGRNLQVFTAGGEYADLGSIITPASINLRSQTSNGSKYVPASEADGSVVYCDRNGKTLREYIYTFNEDSYRSDDISVLSSHLIDNPIDTSYLTGAASDDANWLFVLNTSGNIAILNKLRAQDINGFTSMIMATPYSVSTTIDSVRVVDDQVYFTVRRYDEGGNPVSTIERWDFDRKMDGSYKFDKNSIPFEPSGAAQSVKLRHLIGYTVSIVADGSILPDREVTSALGGTAGEVAFTESEIDNHTEFEIGINFVPVVQPMPINTNIGSGDNFMRLKKIVRLNLRVLETNGVYVDDVPVPARSFDVSTIGDPPSAFTGIIGDLYASKGWSRDTMPVFSCPDPTPMHIQAIDMEVESS